MQGKGSRPVATGAVGGRTAQLQDGQDGPDAEAVPPARVHHGRLGLGEHVLRPVHALGRVGALLEAELPLEAGDLLPASIAEEVEPQLQAVLRSECRGIHIRDIGLPDSAAAGRLLKTQSVINSLPVVRIGFSPHDYVVCTTYTLEVHTSTSESSQIPPCIS
jgi:hypothetical protein